jgi:tryptophan-rich sensory protein
MNVIEKISHARRVRLRAIAVWLVFLAIVFAVAAFGAQFTPGAWYQTLAKPAWTPPSWLFAPVWTVLYAMIATAAALVWLRAPHVSIALGLWGLQLVLNGLWSWLFFGLERPGLAALDIVTLLVAIVATSVTFRPVSRAAALLMMPYALWVAYATALNLAIWNLNR